MLDIMRDDIIAKPLAASYNPRTDTEIYSLQLRYPRIIHAEFMTHRAFSRNASSSRAIPVASMTARDEIFIPKFKYNKPGMQPGDFLNPEDTRLATEIWSEMAEACLKGVKLLGELRVHKQWANRPLEWFGYIDVVMTSTDWANWDHLRDHEDAADEIRVLAIRMKEARDLMRPRMLDKGQWHLPYIRDEDIDQADFICDPHRLVAAPPELALLKNLFGASDISKRIPLATRLLLVISAARCCRVSYAKHDGAVSTLREDIERCIGLVRENSPVHASPFEHQACSWLDGYPRPYQSNLRNFLQLRKLIPFEAIKDIK